ncbi:class I SAM-dependent methyltransferase [Streptomyces parvus]|uniref:class I SAM-dependent methyltransferase n=1 Tax=Streptomyces parvus TaxID=66428 RepID=UPI0036370282
MTGETRTTTYLPGMTVHDYHVTVKEQHPALFELLDPARLVAVADEPWVTEGNEFDDDHTGRGVSYRCAQQHGEARRTGIETILGMFAGPGGLRDMGRVLDVLGGEGLLSRVWRQLAGAGDGDSVPLVTGDLSGHMVAAALRSGLPAVRQPADRMLQRDHCLDGVLFAYGTHHVDRSVRPRMLTEASRVLAPGGRVVLHDFAEGSPEERWFREVVHPRSLAGHAYDHFTAHEMTGYLADAGFTDITVGPVYDPMTLTGETEESALARLVSYMTSMYGILPDGDRSNERTEAALRDIFRFSAGDLPEDIPRDEAVLELTVRPHGDAFRAELPRIALVAHGRKP